MDVDRDSASPEPNGQPALPNADRGRAPHETSAAEREAAERLTTLLADYQACLVAGDISLDEDVGAAGDETIAERLDRAKACFRLLEEMRSAAIADSRETESGPESPIDPSVPRVTDGPNGACPPVAPEPPGAPRIGRFEIIRELGSGGHAVVMLAHDPVLDRDVALKVPLPEILLTADVRRRFATEGQAAARLKHRNLVPVFEVGEIGPICFIASAYCEGPTLAAWLAARAKPVPPRRAAEWISLIARAIHYAHEEGVLHRDLKPSNILLVRKTRDRSAGRSVNDTEFDFDPLVTDFGLAKLAENDAMSTRTGTVLGTPAYMAPEQASGKLIDVGPAADVYALGVILYEMLTGRPPFLADSDLETLRQVHQDEPPQVRKLQPSVPRDLEVICLTCLDKEPARRFTTAGALADDLDRFLASEPVRVRPPSLVRRGRLWVKRHPAQAVMVATVLAVMVGLPAALLWHSLRLEREHAYAVAAQAAAERSAIAARRNEARVRQHMYVSDIRVMQQLRHEGNFGALASLLDRYRAEPDRGLALRKMNVADAAAGAVASAAETPADAPAFEWRYLNRFRDACRLKIAAHAGQVDLLAFSADGNTLATSGIEDGRLRLWAVPSGRELGSFPVRAGKGRRSTEGRAALSADGRRAATLLDAHTVVVWDVSSEAEVARFGRETDMVAVAMSPDGARVAAGCERETVVWDCATGRQVSEHPAGSIVMFVPDGRQLIGVGPGAASFTVSVWDVPASAFKRGLALAGPVRHVACSPDGTMLAVLSDLPDYTDVRIYHPRSTAPVHYLAAESERFSRVAFSGDNRRLVATAADGSLKIWDAGTGKAEGAIRGFGTRLVHLAFSADDRWLATATPDGGVLVWDGRLLDACDELRPQNATVGPVTFSPDGRTLAAATPDRSVLVVDVATGRVDARLPRHVERIADLAFSSDAARLVTTDGLAIRCWRRDDGTPLWHVDSDRTKCVTWTSPSGPVASAGDDYLLHFHDPDDGHELRVIGGHGGAVTGLKFLASSGLLASAGTDARIRLWDPETQKPRDQTLDAGTPIHELACSADGKVLAARLKDGALAIWTSLDPASAPLRMQPFWPGNHRGALAVSPDDRLVGVGGSDSVFRAFDIGTQEMSYDLSGRRVGGMCAAYSPDGHTLATVSREGCLTLWNLEEWTTRTLPKSPHGPVRSLAFSPDGTTLAVSSDEAARSERPMKDNLPAAPNIRQYLPRRAPLGAMAQHVVHVDRVPWAVGGPPCRLWNVATRQEQFLPGDRATSTAIPLWTWSREGTIAGGSHDGTVWIWNAETAAPVARFAVNPASAAALSWGPQAGRHPPARGALKPFDPVTALVFSPGGAQLAVATRSGMVQLARGTTWDERVTLCTDAADVAALAFSPSGSVLVANKRGQIVAWDLRREVSQPPLVRVGHEEDSAVASFAFTPDGKTLAVGRADGTVQFFAADALDAASVAQAEAAPRLVLQGHLDRVTSVSFSPDNRTLATASWDTTVRLWHVASGQELAVFRAHHGKVEAVAFSPDGTVLASGGQRDDDTGEVYLWQGSSP